MENKYAALIERLGFKRPNPEQSDSFLTEEALQTIEAKLGHRLPTDYCEFLRDYPDIKFDGDLSFPVIFDDTDEDANFFGFCGSSGESLTDFYFSLRHLFAGDTNYTLEAYPGMRLVMEDADLPENIGWPRQLLPIGYDQGGNIISIAFAGLRPGAIFFWRSSSWSGRQNLYLVANSFDEFMHLLQKEPEAD